MKNKFIHYAKEIVIFVIVMSVIANIISFYKSTDLNNEPLSSMNLTLIDNTNYKIDNSTTSKPLLIHIWATWCPTCKLEAKNIQIISQDYEVVSIAVKSSKSDIQDYMLENDFNFKVVVDEDGSLASRFNIAVFPTTFIYDKNKKVVFSEVGYTSTFGLYLRMWWAGL